MNVLLKMDMERKSDGIIEKFERKMNIERMPGIITDIRKDYFPTITELKVIG